jgi:hypothetical protein
MKPLTVTVGDVIRRRPCDDYPPRRLRRLFASHEHWTALQIIEEIGSRYQIRPVDLLWTVLHPSLIDEKTLRLLGCRFAEDILIEARLVGLAPDACSWTAIEVARRYAHDKATTEELNDAKFAADVVTVHTEGERSVVANVAANVASAAATRAVRWVLGLGQQQSLMTLNTWSRQLSIVTETLRTGVVPESRGAKA